MTTFSLMDIEMNLFPDDRQGIITDLVQRMDQAEKEKKDKFHFLNDRDVLHYFLYRNTNLNEAANRSDRTIREYELELEQMIRNLLQYAEEIGLDIEDVVEGSLFKSLSPRHVRRYQMWLTESSPYVKENGPYSPATLSRKTVVLKSFFRFLFEKRYITEPLHDSLLTSTVRKDDRPNRDLGPSEVIQLLDYFHDAGNPIVFSLIHVLVGTGLRNDELCRLKMSDVRFDPILGGFYLHVIGKGNKERDIPLKEKVMDSLILYRKARFLSAAFPVGSDEPLLPNSRHMAFRPSYFSTFLGNAIEKVPIRSIQARTSRITPHVFRHSFAIISYVSGANIYDIMRALGHEQIDTTMIYLQKIMDREQHAIHKWNQDTLGRYI
ncbi:tyrosine-type recombinase/integrase [Bacillus sp. 37MA]|uniref:tyrosine-type recombinase/integrase n=1 Tax=Bacillus sp. 37MA TaxID=1132442 RepID=UPI00036A7AAD|nr:tyrosine-type recombinase/integrase [Bacillus sp. 37MA]